MRQHLTENFSQAELEELAFDLGVDTETLLRETKSEFARALILHFEDRDNVERLAREVLVRRPDPGLERDLKNIEAQTSQETAAPLPTASPGRQASATKAWILIPAVLAFAALVIVIALLILRQGGNNSTTGAQSPSPATATAPTSIASDVPGTPLELNTTVRSGVDSTLKPRDVWRVRLEAQRPFTIEVRSSVQDGIGLGLLRPGASRVPDTQETADVNVCSDASSCIEPFTPAITGDYTIVVYGMRPLVNYDLTVNDR